MKHPDQIFDHLTWEQFVDWVAYHDTAPFGDRREDARMGVLFWAILAPWVDSMDRGQAPSTAWPYVDAEAVVTLEYIEAQTEALQVYAEEMRKIGSDDHIATGNPTDA